MRLFVNGNGMRKENKLMRKMQDTTMSSSLSHV